MKMILLGAYILLLSALMILCNKEIRVGFIDSDSGMMDRGPAITMAVEDFQAMGFLQDYTFR